MGRHEADTIRAKPVGLTGGLAADLARREAAGQPIRIGLIGSGEMGTDIVTQCSQMAGIMVAAIAEIDLEAAKKALRIAGRTEESFAVAETHEAFDWVLKSGKVALTADARAVCTHERIDVVIDATGR